MNDKPQYQPKIINCRISQGKLIIQIEDGREVRIAVDFLTEKGYLNKEVKPQQLEKYELQSEGLCLYFPEIDEILPN